MPVKTSHSMILGVVLIGVLLLGGLSFVWFRIGSGGLEHHNARTSDRTKMRAPLIQGRVATEADFHSGAAVFYIPEGRSAPYSFGRDLLNRAKIVKSDGNEWPVGTPVSVVQAEVSDGQHVTLGILHGDEQAVCALEDVKLLP